MPPPHVPAHGAVCAAAHCTAAVSSAVKPAVAQTRRGLSTPLVHAARSTEHTPRLASSGPGNSHRRFHAHASASSARQSLRGHEFTDSSRPWTQQQRQQIEQAQRQDKAWLTEQIDSWWAPNGAAASGAIPAPELLLDVAHAPVRAAGASVPATPIVYVSVPPAVMEAPLPSSFPALMSALAPYNEPRSRFAMLERALTEWTCVDINTTEAAGPRWEDCVRVLAQMRAMAVEAEAQHDVEPSQGAVSCTLTLHHFHRLLRVLLHASMLPSRWSGVRFPSGLRASELDGTMLRFCAGMSAGEEHTPANEQDATLTETDTSSSERMMLDLRPDFQLPLRVLASCAHARHPHASTPAAPLPLQSDTDSTTADATAGIDPQGETMWLLAWALQDLRRPGDFANSNLEHGAPEAVEAIVDSADAQLETSSAEPASSEDSIHVENTPDVAVDVAPPGATLHVEDGAINTEHTVLPSPAAVEHTAVDPAFPSLPPLALLRHLSSAMLASELRPTLQTLNFFLAICDEHARTEEVSRGMQHAVDSAAMHEREEASGSGVASADVDAEGEDQETSSHEDVEFVWRLWVDATRLHEVHPDVLSHMLMLRFLVRHRAWNYVSRVLSAHERQSMLCRRASAMLHHDFVHPHLLSDAFTHSSAANNVSSGGAASGSGGGKRSSYERMEFLGDAVLDVSIREMIVGRMSALVGLPLRSGDEKVIGCEEQEIAAVDDDLPTVLPTSSPPPMTFAQGPDGLADLPFISRLYPLRGGGGNRDAGIVDPSTTIVSSSAAAPVDVSSPSLLLPSSLVPLASLGQLKGKHVSHTFLASLSRQVGLSSLFLDLNENVQTSIRGFVKNKESEQEVRIRLGQAAPEPNKTRNFTGTKKQHEYSQFRGGRPRSVQEMPSPLSMVSDSLAEDVFETCLGALFLDAPAEVVSDESATTDDAAATPLERNDDALLRIPNSSAAASPLHGFTAVNRFLHRSLGEDLDFDLRHFVARWAPPRARGNTHAMQVLHATGFDARENYKALLEAHVRERYASSSSGQHCNAHVLYWMRDSKAGHTFKVSVVIKVLPDGYEPRHRVQQPGQHRQQQNHQQNQQKGNKGGWNGTAATQGQQQSRQRGDRNHQRQQAAPAMTAASDKPISAPAQEEDELLSLARALQRLDARPARSAAELACDESDDVPSRARPSRKEYVPRAVLNTESSEPSVYTDLHADARAHPENYPYIRLLRTVENIQSELAHDSPTAFGAQHMHHSAPSFSSPASASISYSVSNQTLPRLNLSYDRLFPSAVERPLLQSAEQMAAFLACENLGLTGGTRGAEKKVLRAERNEELLKEETKMIAMMEERRKQQITMQGVLTQDSTDATPTLPFPFTDANEYSSLLSSLERITGHRFSSPLIVRGLLFHSGLNRSFEFLGSGLVRFFASLYGFREFPHFQEGALTQLKDALTAKIHTGAIVQSEEMAREIEEILERTEKAKLTWMATQNSAERDDVPSSHSRRDQHPLVSSCDFYEPLLAALFLNGGWAAVDSFARATLHPRMMALSRLYAHWFPEDRELGEFSFKASVQSLVQRRYGLTPSYECVQVRERKWSVRLVIPAVNPLLRVKGYASGELRGSAFDEALSSLAPRDRLLASLFLNLPPGATITPNQGFIAFETFLGTKGLSEERAARQALHALNWIKPSMHRVENESTEEVQEGERSTVDENDGQEMEFKPRRWHPSELRGVLHECVAAMRGSSDASEAFGNDFDEVAARLQALVAQLLEPECHEVACGGAGHASSDLPLHHDEHDMSVDPFEAAVACLPSKAGSASPFSSARLSKTHFTSSDYTLLLECLCFFRCTPSFPLVWTLIGDRVGSGGRSILLSERALGFLIDGLGSGGHMALIIQSMRHARSQQQERNNVAVFSRNFLERVMLRSTQSNPQWAWQQCIALLDEMSSTGQTPTTASFNHALFMCLRGMEVSVEASRARRDAAAASDATADSSHTTAEDAESFDDACADDTYSYARGSDSTKPANLTLIVRAADKVRRRMASAAAVSAAEPSNGDVRPDALTFALVASLDALTGCRLEGCVKAIEAAEAATKAEMAAKENVGEGGERWPEVIAAREWLTQHSAPKRPVDAYARWSNDTPALSMFPHAAYALPVSPSGSSSSPSAISFDVTPLGKCSQKSLVNNVGNGWPLVLAAREIIERVTQQMLKFSQRAK